MGLPSTFSTPCRIFYSHIFSHPARRSHVHGATRLNQGTGGVMWPPRGSLAIHHQLESISVNYAAVLIADRQHNAATEAEVAKCQTIQRGDEAS